jgi:hypothetical protein
MNLDQNQEIDVSQETKQSESLSIGKKQSRLPRRSIGEPVNISNLFEIRINDGNIVLFKKGTTAPYGYYSSIDGLYLGLMKKELFESNGNIEALQEMFNSHYEYIKQIISTINKNEENNEERTKLKREKQRIRAEKRKE